jgi:hypothetical protein
MCSLVTPYAGLRRDFTSSVRDLDVLTDVLIAMWRELEEEAAQKALTSAPGYAEQG